MIKVLHFVSKMDRAGQETFIMNVYRNINRNEIQFCFLCSDSSPGEFDDEIISMGGNIYCLPPNNYKSGVKKYYKEISNIASWLAENKAKYSVVHLHTYHALDVFVHLAACQLANVKNIIIHSHNTNGPHHLLHKIFRLLDNMYHCTRFACSYNAGIWLYGEKKMKKGNVSVIYNGITPSDYLYSSTTAGSYRKQLGLENKVVIGHIGRFSVQKNHRFLLNVFKEYSRLNTSSTLVLVGKGELENHIRTTAKELNIEDKVIFLGSRKDVTNLMMMMDVLFFPSLHEGLSVVLVEAQAAGLSCLVSSGIVPVEERIIPDIFNELDLNENINTWVNELEKSVSKDIDRLKCNSIVEKSCFNIVLTAKRMENEYKQIAKYIPK